MDDSLRWAYSALTDDFIYGYRIAFRDGGPPEVKVLGFASTVEECEKIASQFPAVSYSGQRQIEGAEFFWQQIGEPRRKSDV